MAMTGKSKIINVCISIVSVLDIVLAFTVIVIGLFLLICQIWDDFCISEADHVIAKVKAEIEGEEIATNKIREKWDYLYTSLERWRNCQLKPRFQLSDLSTRKKKDIEECNSLFDLYFKRVRFSQNKNEIKSACELLDTLEKTKKSNSKQNRTLELKDISDVKTCQEYWVLQDLSFSDRIVKPLKNRKKYIYNEYLSDFQDLTAEDSIDQFTDYKSKVSQFTANDEEKKDDFISKISRKTKDNIYSCLKKIIKTNLDLSQNTSTNDPFDELDKICEKIKKELSNEPKMASLSEFANLYIEHYKGKKTMRKNIKVLVNLKSLKANLDNKTITAQLDSLKVNEQKLDYNKKDISSKSIDLLNSNKNTQCEISLDGQYPVELDYSLDEPGIWNNKEHDDWEPVIYPMLRKKWIVLDKLKSYNDANITTQFIFEFQNNNGMKTVEELFNDAFNDAQ